ncbi:MAG TPA: LysR substrate-binding domain-containing protein, partial [Burkholderiaceae bacterium]
MIFHGSLWRRPRAATAWHLEHATTTSNSAQVDPLAANNSGALRDAALSGLGIALLPDFSAQAALQAGKLVEVLPAWRPVGAFAEQLYAIRPCAVQVPRAVAAFVDWLRA